mmetsp:Transcript_4783/g.6588  ORF Transcript_4783/g.6588 Transcript_4783/m.6588 type:complete len:231 (-) Transcript_4783:108-800(-)
MPTEECSLTICGDGSVGKSTITNAFRTEGFLPVYKQTIGVDFYEKKLQVRGDILISLRLWDVGGQSIQSKNLKGYISHSDAIMLVYDVTNTESFRNLEDWLIQIRPLSKQTAKIYLVANKIDLIALRQVNSDDHDRFIVENQLSGGLMVSAKTGENVVKCFYKIASEAVGIKLTEYELGFYDKVLPANISGSKNDELRNAWADDIEKEDLLAEQRKKLSSENKVKACICS